jgi:hypothetical protein
MEEINLDSHFNSPDTPSVNFGGGIELLMNDRKKSSSTPTEHISLEDELKELDSFSAFKPVETKPMHFRVEKEDSIPLGKNTISFDTPQMDGFKHIDNIPIEEEIKKVEHKTKEELLKDKFQYLRKLEALEQKGVTLSKRYSMDSSLDEMKGEYEYIIAEKEQKNSVQFQGKVLTTIITGLEFLNGKFDPFDIKLDGWSEQINENLDDYDEIFAELHDKYKSKAKMAPELKLLFQLAGSGMMIHMTNTMFKSAIPGMDDIMRQNPDLMQQFTKAAVNSMEKTSPGLGGFMKEFGQAPVREEMRQEYRPREESRQEFRPREEMRGPDNINSILSSLNKKIDLNDKNESTISIEEINNITNMPAPRKGGRKSRSDKSMSLDLSNL